MTFLLLAVLVLVLIGVLGSALAVIQILIVVLGTFAVLVIHVLLPSFLQICGLPPR